MLFNYKMSFEELMVTRFFVTLTIAVLLFSVTISNFNFNVYAEDENVDEYKKKVEHKEYKDEKREEREEYKEEKRIDSVKCPERTVTGTIGDREMVLKFRCLDDDNNQKYPDEEKKELKKQYNELKNEFREKLKQIHFSKIKTLDHKDLTSEEISDMEKTRKELYELIKQFREQIKELKIKHRLQFKELHQQTYDTETDRKNKVNKKIAMLKLQYKDKIKEHKLIEINGELDGKIMICHYPPGNTDNAHGIYVSQNAETAHLAHGDELGECATDLGQTDSTGTTDSTGSSGGTGASGTTGASGATGMTGITGMNDSESYNDENTESQN